MKLLKAYLHKIYKIFISNWKQFLILGIIYLLIFAIFSPIFNFSSDLITQKLELLDASKLNNSLTKWIAFGLIGFFITTTLILTFHNFFVFVLSKLFDKQKFNYFKEIKNNLKYFWKIFLFSFIELIIITLGLFLFLLPGIYCLFVFYFTLPILANENLSIIESIKKANKIFKTNFWKNISIILLIKLAIIILLIFASIIKMNGIIALADWFISSALIYLIIYNPIELKKQNE